MSPEERAALEALDEWCGGLLGLTYEGASGYLPEGVLPVRFWGWEHPPKREDGWAG